MPTTISADTPRSPEVLIQHVRTIVQCPHCGAQAGNRCGIHGRGIHLGRFIHALVLRKITVEEIAVVLGDLDVFTNATIIRDGAR